MWPSTGAPDQWLNTARLADATLKIKVPTNDLAWSYGEGPSVAAQVEAPLRMPPRERERIQRHGLGQRPDLSSCRRSGPQPDQRENAKRRHRISLDPGEVLGRKDGVHGEIRMPA
jgi:hypothetical protein